MGKVREKEKKGLIAYFLFLGIVAAAFIVWGNLPTDTREEYYFWATALIIINLVPYVVYLSQAKKNIPFLPMVGAHYIIGYALPVFFMDTNDYQLGELEAEALVVCFYGLFFFYTFYYLASGIFYFNFHYSPFDQEDETKPELIKKLMYFFILIALAGRFFSISFIYHFSEPSFYVFTGLFLFLKNLQKINLAEISLVVFIIISEIVFRIVSGMLAEVAVFLLFVLIIQFVLSKKLNLLPVIFFIAFYAVTSPVKFKFREAVWFGEKKYTKWEQFIIMKDLTIENFNSEKENPMGLGEGKEHFLWRFSYPASALSFVQSVTPDVIPYWEGYTYMPLFSKFIPRFLWPDKPVEEMGQEFGQRYKILDTTDTSTSMNLPWMAELYANWGEQGVYIGYALFGILFSFINRYFNYSSNSDLNLIVSAAIIFQLVVHESNFSLQVGNIPLLAVSLVLFVRVSKKHIKIEQ